ncbi:MAG: serine/threonine-protein kinase [Pseudomonadota bacterium]
MLKKPLHFETASGVYVASEVLGEGGAGIVYGGTAPDGTAVAIKILSLERATADKRRRFKNELSFLARNRHPNIVTVVDHGVERSEKGSKPFCVMRRYEGSLRTAMAKSLPHAQVLPFLSQILDGVEAAHLQSVVHRDLKPENVLIDSAKTSIAIADFGVARFTEDLLVTLVETSAAQRLANFLYAAPEQRAPGRDVGVPADIYALGLLVNELFTGAVPHGTDYKQIATVSKEHSYLDPLVAMMLRQAPNERPQSIAEIKGLIQRYQSEAVTLQRLSALSGTVIPESQIDDPLAEEQPQLIAAEWNDGRLVLTLDRAVSQGWVWALQNMGNFSAVMGRGPETFSFSGTTARVPAQEHEAQDIINHFKQWMPVATRTLKQKLQLEAKRKDEARRGQLRREREVEETRLRVNRGLKI